jgi:hypothetical protein
MPINTPFEFLKKKENVEVKKPIIVADYRDGRVVLLKKKAGAQSAPDRHCECV